MKEIILRERAKEIINAWLSALESGKYKQGSGAMRNCENEYSCLGILCEVTNLAEWQEWNKWNPYRGYPGPVPIFLYLDWDVFLPPEVQYRARMWSDSGMFYVTDEWWEQLPKEVREKVEPYLRSQNNKYKKLGRKPTHKYYLPYASSLAGMNDAGIEFQVIAAVIRSRPKGLFVDDD